MMYTEDTCPNLACGDCLYFKVNADLQNVESTCKRLDHKKVKFYTPWFKGYDCGQRSHIICRDFAPAHPQYADLKEWTNFDDYWSIYVKAWLPYGNENMTVAFILNGNRDIWYHVPLKRFIDGTMIVDGVLQATEKLYFKRDRIEHGVQLYRVVKEKIDGVPIDICTNH